MSLGPLAVAVDAAHQAEWPDVGPWQSFGEVEFDLDIRWALYRSEGAGVILRAVEATPGPPELVEALSRADESGWA